MSVSNLQRGGRVNHDSILRYLSACEFALKTLGNDAEKYFSRLHRLSQFNSKEELESIVLGWRQPDAAPPPPPQGDWAIGSRWGDTVRVIHRSGIFWKLRCRCGQLFEVSTNDSTPEERRKCPNCILADELSDTKRQLAFKLEETAQTVLSWYRDYGKLVWDRVHTACRKRGISDPNVAKELNALAWVKIAEIASRYDPKRARVSTWLYRCVDNAIKDHFKVSDNRARLALTVPLASEDGRDAAAPPTKSEEVLPAKPTRPEGASPDGLNKNQASWDKRQTTGWGNA